jgi:NDP-sugar pyrophosphorylase family protein
VLPATLERLAEAETRHPEAAMIFPTVETPDPYVHFQRNAEGRIVELRQRREGDAMPERGESDMGVFALRRAAFEGELAAFASQAIAGSGTGERNFLPFIPWLAARRPVRTIGCTDPRERVGINTPEDLAAVAAWLRERPARV